MSWLMDMDREWWLGKKLEREKPTITVRGQILKVSEGLQSGDRIYLYLSGLLDESKESWLPLLPEMPCWALTGAVFKAELSDDALTFEELAKRPWAIRNFEPSPTVFLSDDELRIELGIGD